MTTFKDFLRSKYIDELKGIHFDEYEFDEWCENLNNESLATHFVRYFATLDDTQTARLAYQNINL